MVLFLKKKKKKKLFKSQDVLIEIACGTKVLLGQTIEVNLFVLFFFFFIWKNG